MVEVIRKVETEDLGRDIEECSEHGAWNRVVNLERRVKSALENNKITHVRALGILRNCLTRWSGRCGYNMPGVGISDRVDMIRCWLMPEYDPPTRERMVRERAHLSGYRRACEKEKDKAKTWMVRRFIDAMAAIRCPDVDLKPPGRSGRG